MATTRVGLFGAVAAYLGFSAKAGAPDVIADDFVIVPTIERTVRVEGWVSTVRIEPVSRTIGDL